MRFNRLRDIGLTEQQIKDNLLFTTDKVGGTMKSAIDPRQAKEWFGANPPDLSVIGCADIPQAAWNAYQLTTCRQPGQLLTDQVMQIIRQRAETPELPHATFTLPATLVLRKTVRASAVQSGPP